MRIEDEKAEEPSPALPRLADHGFGVHPDEVLVAGDVLEDAAVGVASAAGSVSTGGLLLIFLSLRGVPGASSHRLCASIMRRLSHTRLTSVRFSLVPVVVALRRPRLRVLVSASAIRRCEESADVSAAGHDGRPGFTSPAQHGDAAAGGHRRG